MTEVRTTCPYCGVGCGVIARIDENGAARIAGDPEHPANFGKLCSKGLALAETLLPTGRLAHPHIGGERSSWEKATALVAEKFSSAIREHGPDSVALYVSGQMLTEDYYVANKFMKGFVGSANIDTNSRLCMASAVAAHKRAFGADVVPCNYEDLESADLVLLVGSNAAWCHPVLFQRLLAAREKRGTKIVVIDPRRTASAESADVHLQIKPQSDVALFNGLLRYLYLNGHSDSKFVFAHTSGLSEALLAAREWTIEKVADETGLSKESVGEFYLLFARHDRTVSPFSMGVNQSRSGTDKANAIINVHLLTGRIGKPGAGPFSLTGQPNAMGGREVGGLANILAAHMDIENPEHRAAVQHFWQSPKIAEKPGLKAVDLFRAVHDGRIKVLWIMGTNPAVSLPDSSFVAEALQRCEFVVVSEVMAKTETTQYADVSLPAQGWSEKDGTVTNSERRISRQRQFATALGEAKPDWRIICDVASAMGFDGFAYNRPQQIFAEHVALTTISTSRERTLNLSHYVGANYETLNPTQWGGERPFSDGLFQTPDSRARFVATVYRADIKPDVTLNTGRIRDQWHTMTRTGLVPRLFSQRAEPHFEIHPFDAAAMNIEPGHIIEGQGQGAKLLGRALVTGSVMPGHPFYSMHWNSMFANAALANASTPQDTDPTSGQPALKSGALKLSKFPATWYGFGISVSPPNFKADYFSQKPIAGGISFECAGLETPVNWVDHVLPVMDGTMELSSLRQSDGGTFRCVVLSNDELVFAFFASPQPVAASREWLQSLIGQKASPLAVLSGRPAQGVFDKGPILCACMQVGRNELANYIEKHPSVAETDLCKATGAGTGCGTCRSEIRKMLATTQPQKGTTPLAQPLGHSTRFE